MKEDILLPKETSNFSSTFATLRILLEVYVRTHINIQPIKLWNTNNTVFFLGDLEYQEFDLLEPNLPAFGLKLRYFHGESCVEGQRREVTYKFICDPHSKGIPIDAKEYLNANMKSYGLLT